MLAPSAHKHRRFAHIRHTCHEGISQTFKPVLFLSGQCVEIHALTASVVLLCQLLLRCQSVRCGQFLRKSHPSDIHLIKTFPVFLTNPIPFILKRLSVLVCGYLPLLIHKPVALCIICLKLPLPLSHTVLYTVYGIKYHGALSYAGMKCRDLILKLIQ